MEEFITWACSVGTSIVVAIPTALISVHFALKKYRTEKWWNAKLSCYFDIIAALNSLIVYCDSQLDVQFEEVAHTAEQLKTNEAKYHEAKYHEARAHLQAQINLGELLLDKESYDAIFKFNSRLFSEEREDDYIKRISGIGLIARECVAVVVDNAKKDLGVN